MKIIIDTEENLAKRAAQRYVELIKNKPNAVLGGATGSTPLGLYAELARLCKAGEISFKDVRTFNLDEYVGLDGSHDQSYRYFMNHNLFEHIDIDINNTRRSKRPAGSTCSFSASVWTATSVLTSPELPGTASPTWWNWSRTPER